MVGGGPAGCAAAFFLARNGARPLLLEKNTSPQSKVCGEVLSSTALGVLEEMGVTPRALGAAPITRILFCAGCQKMEYSLRHPRLALSRTRLDEAIQNAARRAGAEVLPGLAVQGLVTESDGTVLQTSAGAIKAVRILWASGKRDHPFLPARQGGESGWLGLKPHLRLPEHQRQRLEGLLEMHLLASGYVGLCNVEAGLSNLCGLIRVSAFRGTGADSRAFLELLARQSPLLAQTLEQAETLTAKPLAVAAQPYGYLQKLTLPPKGLLRIGDQFAVFPPLCGEGMAAALLSGRLAGFSLAGKDDVSLKLALRRGLAPPLRVARWMHRGAAHPLVRTAILRLMARRPDILETLEKTMDPARGLLNIGVS